MSVQKITVEDEVKNSDLSESLKKHTLDFVSFLKDNEFSIEREGDEDGKGWKIVYKNECIGHMNFANIGIWIDTCDFGDSADGILKETTWANVRVCDYFSSGGKRCGCHDQPGLTKVIFGKVFNNLCFALLEFMNPDAETLENIKKLMLLFKQSKGDMQRF